MAVNFSAICNLIEKWEPDDEYDTEGEYRDDLMDYLEKNLHDSEQVFPESGRSLCDISISNAIGIEMKLDLHKIADSDRLQGQIHRHLKQYSTGLIVVLIGQTNSKALNNVKEFVEDFPLPESKEIKIIKKLLENDRESDVHNEGNNPSISQLTDPESYYRSFQKRQKEFLDRFIQ